MTLTKYKYELKHLKQAIAFDITQETYTKEEVQILLDVVLSAVDNNSAKRFNRS